MKGFISITAEGKVLLGVAQIASVERGGLRNRSAHIRMGGGAQFVTAESYEAVLELIAEAVEPPAPKRGRPPKEHG